MSLWNPHNKDNKPQEHFVRLLKKWDAYQSVICGGNWGNTSDSGSRCSNWNNAPSDWGSSISARGVCKHLESK